MMLKSHWQVIQAISVPRQRLSHLRVALAAITRIASVLSPRSPALPAGVPAGTLSHASESR